MVLRPAHPPERSATGVKVRRPSPVPSEVSAPLRVERRGFDGWVSMALVGELDLASAPLLDAELVQPSALAELVVLDLGRLSFMDVAGLRAVMAADARQRETGGRLVLMNCCPQVRRLLDLSGAAERLELASQPGDLPVEPAPEPGSDRLAALGGREC